VHSLFSAGIIVAEASQSTVAVQAEQAEDYMIAVQH
jgi:hypothetical protein